MRQYAANGDDWTSGDIHLWGVCLQQGNDPKKGYARTWASQTPPVNAGLAAGPTVIAAPDNTTSPLKVHGPGSDLADNTLLELTAGGELILAGGSGNSYPLAELAPASNPYRWAGVIKVKTPAGATLGYILSCCIRTPEDSSRRPARPLGHHPPHLGHPGQARPHASREEGHRTQARVRRRPGTRGLEPVAVHPGKGV